jgi:hypothetical protein
MVRIMGAIKATINGQPITANFEAKLVFEFTAMPSLDEIDPGELGLEP